MLRMISPFGAVGLAGLLLALGSAAHAQQASSLRPLARPAALVISDQPPPVAPVTDPAAPESATEVSATAPAPEEPAQAPAAEEPEFAGPVLGPETNLPLPRYVSLKTNEGNVRRGPSLSHRIDWVFTREDMPLQITAEYGHWRRVIDREGLGGWVHYSLLSGTRTVIVDQDMLPLLARPDAGATENALLEQGVIARLGECIPDWCRLSAGGYRGWAPKAALWGVDASEIRE